MWVKQLHQIRVLCRSFKEFLGETHMVVTVLPTTQKPFGLKRTLDEPFVNRWFRVEAQPFKKNPSGTLISQSVCEAAGPKKAAQ